MHTALDLRTKRLQEQTSVPLCSQRAGLTWGWAATCSLLFQAVEVRCSSCFPLPGQAGCVLALEHVWGQEEEQTVNSWTSSGNDRGLKERKELVYSGGNVPVCRI